jgi:hypothetical protein
VPIESCMAELAKLQLGSLQSHTNHIELHDYLDNHAFTGQETTHVQGTSVVSECDSADHDNIEQ